jgi:hypothetical protein
MIITRKRAVDIVSNPENIKLIPPLQPAYEAYKQKQAEISRTQCSACKASKNLNSVGDMALNIIISLQEPFVSKLKQVLNTTEPLFAYISDSSGVRMIELGK